MKRVLLLDGSGGQDLSDSHRRVVERLCQKLSALDNFEYDLGAIQHLTLEIKGPMVRFLVNSVNQIDDYDFVIFRNAYVNRDIASAASLYLNYKGKAYSNGIDGSGAYSGKLTQMVLFALNNLPVPQTVFAKNYLELQKLTDEKLSKPFIVKDSLGISGKRNYLLDTKDSVVDLLDGRKESYMAQEYIQNDGDYRIFYIGHEGEPLIFKRKSIEGSHLNNTSQGAKAELVSVASFPKDALTSAKRAAELFERTIVGVDIIFDADGNHYVLEANETPALASGFMPEKKLLMLDQYLKDAIK